MKKLMDLETYDSLRGEIGPQGERGPQGPQGPRGEKGDTPVLPIVMTKIERSVDKPLSFVVYYSNGATDEVTLDGLKEMVGVQGNGVFGGGGGLSRSQVIQLINENAGGIQYVEITDTTYTVTEAELIVGQNIFGVNSTADSTVNLPTITDSTKLVIVKNEMECYTVTTKAA